MTTTPYHVVEDEALLEVLRHHPLGLSRSRLAATLRIVLDTAIDFQALGESLVRLENAGQLVSTSEGGPRHRWLLWRLAEYGPRRRLPEVGIRGRPETHEMHRQERARASGGDYPSPEEG